MLQREPDTLTVSALTGDTADPVKVSFFGGIDTGRVGDPEQTEDSVLRVASLLDLFGTKLKVLLQRVAARDYLDLAAILQAGVPLKDGLGAATTLYGRQFPPTDAVKALSYFVEGDAANVDSATQRFLFGASLGLGLHGHGDRQSCRVTHLKSQASSPRFTRGSVPSLT